MLDFIKLLLNTTKPENNEIKEAITKMYKTLS